jgi:hypothetical protein
MMFAPARPNVTADSYFSSVRNGSMVAFDPTLPPKLHRSDRNNDENKIPYSPFHKSSIVKFKYIILFKSYFELA